MPLSFKHCMVTTASVVVVVFGASAYGVLIINHIGEASPAIKDWVALSPPTHSERYKSSLSVDLGMAVIEGGVFVAPRMGRIIYFMRVSPQKIDPLRKLVHNEISGNAETENGEAEELAGSSHVFDQVSGGGQASSGAGNTQGDLGKEQPVEEIDLSSGRDDHVQEADAVDEIVSGSLEEEDTLLAEIDLSEDAELLEEIDLPDSEQILRESEVLENQEGIGPGHYFSFLVESQLAAIGVAVDSISLSEDGDYLLIHFGENSEDEEGFDAIAIRRNIITGGSEKQTAGAETEGFQWPPIRVVLRWVFVVLASASLVLVFFGAGVEGVVAVLFFCSLIALTFVDFAYYFPKS